MFRKLKRLNLGGNGLRQVPQRALATLEVLRKLEMQENELTEIKEADFEGKKNLFCYVPLPFKKIKTIVLHILHLVIFPLQVSGI